MGGIGSGGPRTPANPAPVSGPGALSKRTDGGQPMRQVTGQPYGEAQAFAEQQTAAPLAQAPGLPSAQGGPQPPAMPAQMPMSFHEPTQHPDEPVTAGAAIGPGPGVSALGISDAQLRGYQNASDTIKALAARDPDNPALQYLAAQLQNRY